MALPLGNDPSFDGFMFRTHWVPLDPGANTAGLVTSDGQMLTMKFF